MPRDKTFTTVYPTPDAISDPFTDFFYLESQEYIFEKSKRAILNLSIVENLETMGNLKSKLKRDHHDYFVKVSLPEFDGRYGRRLSYDASSFFTRARYFLKLSFTEDLAVFPIFGYYGQTFFFSSMINIFFRVTKPKESHGISIIWPENMPEDNQGLTDEKVNSFLMNTCVRVDTFGGFSRICNLFTILGEPSIFSLGNISEDNLATQTLNLFGKTTPFTLSLKEILNFQYSNLNLPENSYSIASSEILFDYLTLFIASSLARYKPTIWNQTSIGKTVILPDILKVRKDQVSLLHWFYAKLVKLEVLPGQNVF